MTEGVASDPYVECEVFFQKFASDGREGGLVLTFAVPYHAKQAAFLTTDLQGEMVLMRIHRFEFEETGFDLSPLPAHLDPDYDPFALIDEPPDLES